MTELVLPNGRDGYHVVLDHVMQSGVRSAPRGLATLDAGEVTIVLESPYDALPLRTGRGVSRKIAAAEAIQLIGGFSVPRLLPESFKRFQEDNGSFWGAYGIRIGGQLAEVVRKLRSDRDTRQAVITLWNPMLDNVDPPKRDHPCTVALGFRIRNDQLDARVLMRSSDAWLGIPYDFFQFTQLQLTLARLLNVEPGRYVHTTWSLHIYVEHLLSATRVTHSTPSSDAQPEGIGDDQITDVSELQERALHIALDCDRTDLTSSERWYVDALSS